MTPLLLAVALAAGADPAPKVDGKWLIVYAEENGRRNNSWENRQATVSGGKLSYAAEGGKEQSLELKFGDGQTVKATAKGGEGGAAAGSHSGVYIASQDYLCLSLNADGKDKARGSSSGSFILILRKQRGG